LINIDWPRFATTIKAPPHISLQPVLPPDDAPSKAVEILSETKRYIDRNNSSGVQALPLLHEPLPDLKTASVRGSRFLSCSVDLIGLAQVHRWTFKNNGVLFRDEPLRTGID